MRHMAPSRSPFTDRFANRRSGVLQDLWLNSPSTRGFHPFVGKMFLIWLAGKLHVIRTGQSARRFGVDVQPIMERIYLGLVEVREKYMKRMAGRIWLATVLVTLGGAFPTGSAKAAAAEGLPESTCPTSFLLRYPQRCARDGSGAARIELARRGLDPPDPLPIASVDPALGYLPFNYLRVSRAGASFYPSLESARQGGGGVDRTSPGFVYLSYPDGGIYQDEATIIFQSQLGYVRGDNVSRVTPSAFKGLAFVSTPVRPFGWVISGGSCPELDPGGELDLADRCFMRYETVQIYGERVVDDELWYQVGINQWLPAAALAIVEPDPERPPGISAQRWITVNLEQQTVAAYEAGKLVYATLSSTGREGTWTQPGAFQVWARLQRDNMMGGIDKGYYYLEDVPWVLYFDQSRALHGTYWHDQFGTPNSRGCVNLSITDARWFFEFAQEGSWVYVWDPTGETPTDPAHYSAGGA